MQFYFAYYAVFVSLCGSAICAPPPSGEKSDAELRKFCAFKDLTSGSQTISSENACLAFTKKALSFFEQCPKEGEPRGDADLKIRYRDIENVVAKDDTVKIKHGSSETALRMNDAVPAQYLAERLQERAKDRGSRKKGSTSDQTSSADEQ